MKTEELTAIGLTEEQATQVLAMNGRDIEKHKKSITALETERDDLQGRLSTAETTLKGFEGIDPAKIQQEIQTYKQQAEDAEKRYAAQITQRDQRDWLRGKFDEYGVTSPYARKQLEVECMAENSGCAWRDGAFFGFDDFMKAAKAKDTTLYQTAEEKAAAEKAAQQQERAPIFTGSVGSTGGAEKKGAFTPPKIF